MEPHFCFLLSAFQNVFYIHLVLSDLSGLTESMKPGSKEVAYLSMSTGTLFFKSIKAKIKRLAGILYKRDHSIPLFNSNR